MDSSPSSKAVVTLSLLFLSLLSARAQLQWPFQPQDLLPDLPGQLSWSILKQLEAPADVLPKFVGYATSNGNILEWEGSCFQSSRAWLEFHNDSGTEVGGGTLHLQLYKPKNWYCVDIYLFATPYRFVADFYLKRGDKELDFYEWENKQECEYVKKQGVSIFLLRAGLLDTIKELAKIWPLFSNDEAGEEASINFLKNEMGAVFELRPEPSWVSNINPADINSGDFLALSKIRGSAGAFETLEKWVTGAYAGHAAVCIRDPQGKLWVGESGRVNDKGLDIIQVIPWEEWWEFEREKDPASPHIALLPLHPNQRAKFNEAAAWNYAVSVNNTAYGYHNVIFSWIDTVKDNYPNPMSPELVASAMTIFGIVKPGYEVDLWNEALNKRLGTQGLALPEILAELQKRGSTFGELLAIPEQDDWVYSDGKSASCVAFAMAVHKHAGLFDPIADSIQTTEFTVRDGYMVKFYEDDMSRLPKWCNEGDEVKLPFCQILGKYRMELPGYNTLEPYAHMNEKCPSLPPDYERPSSC